MSTVENWFREYVQEAFQADPRLAERFENLIDKNRIFNLSLFYGLRGYPPCPQVRPRDYISVISILEESCLWDSMRGMGEFSNTVIDDFVRYINELNLTDNEVGFLGLALLVMASRYRGKAPWVTQMGVFMSWRVWEEKSTLVCY